MFVYKTDANADTFYKVYKAHRKQNPDAKFLLHFRISTHGTITEDNLHPFIINDKVALIHNGTVDLKDHLYADKRSDTRFLCEEILAKLPDGWHLSEGVHSFIKEIGGWSKFVLLDLDNNHAIIKESEGHWDDKGNWFSNSSYKQVSQYIDYGGTKVKRGTTGSSKTVTGFGKYSTSSWDDEEYGLGTTYNKTTDGNSSKVVTSVVDGKVNLSLHDTFNVENFLHSKNLTAAPISGHKSQTKRYCVGLSANIEAVDYLDHLNYFNSGLNDTNTAELNSWYFAGGKMNPDEYGVVVLENSTVFGLGGRSGDKTCAIYPSRIDDLFLIGQILRMLNHSVKQSMAAKGEAWYQSSIDLALVIDKAVIEWSKLDEHYTTMCQC
jgi:hypothetical protein